MLTSCIASLLDREGKLAKWLSRLAFVDFLSSKISFVSFCLMSRVLNLELYYLLSKKGSIFGVSGCIPIGFTNLSGTGAPRPSCMFGAEVSDGREGCSLIRRSIEGSSCRYVEGICFVYCPSIKFTPGRGGL